MRQVIVVACLPFGLFLAQPALGLCGAELQSNIWSTAKLHSKSGLRCTGKLPFYSYREAAVVYEQGFSGGLEGVHE